MKVTPHPAIDATRLRHGYGEQVGRWSRRQFLARNALGLGSVALAWLLREDNLLATPPNMTASRSPLTSSPRFRCSVRKPEP